MGNPIFEWTAELYAAVSAISLAGIGVEKNLLLEKPDFFFAHYTSAETLIKILDKRVIYLRNSRLMNDSSEVWHGFVTTLNALENTDGGRSYLNEWDSLHQGTSERILKGLLDYSNRIIPNCFIFSVCEHREPKNHDGLLSMWRAYGSGDLRIAVLAKPKPSSTLASEGVFLTPVLYGDEQDVGHELAQKAETANLHRPELAKLGVEHAAQLAIALATNLAVSIKHPGFHEEKEWRLVLMSNFLSEEMKRRRIITTVGGIPQIVYTIPIMTPSDNDFDPSSLFLHQVILGPCNEKETIRDGLVEALRNYGFNNADSLVRTSGIPYRQRI